jgi:hypothetical protein
MKNVTMKIDKNILTITVDLKKKAGLSKSGKSMTIATTEGNQALSGDFAEVKVGLNVFKPASEK